MTETRTKELAFETVIEAHLLQHGHECVPADAIDRERAIFPQTALAFIRETQPPEWAKPEALHGDKAAEQILTDLCKWMDVNGSLATPLTASASPANFISRRAALISAAVTGAIEVRNANSTAAVETPTQ